MNANVILQMALEDKFVNDLALRLREYLTQAYEAYNAWTGPAATCPPFMPPRGSRAPLALQILVDQGLFLPVDNPDGVSLGTYRITQEGRVRALRFVEYDEAQKGLKIRKP